LRREGSGAERIWFAEPHDREEGGDDATVQKIGERAIRLFFFRFHSSF
jgi:hypothetical protein